MSFHKKHYDIIAVKSQEGSGGVDGKFAGERRAGAFLPAVCLSGSAREVSCIFNENAIN